MATINTDLKIYYSGANKDGEAVSESYLSLGGYRSSYLVSNGALDNVFDEITVGAAYNGQEDTRCIFLKNGNGVDAMVNLSLYVEGKNDYEELKFGVSLPTSSTGYVQKLNSVYDLPYGVTLYEAYAEPDKKILKASLAAGDMLALWLRRKILTPTEMAVEDITQKQKSDLILKFVWT